MTNLMNEWVTEGIVEQPQLNRVFKKSMSEIQLIFKSLDAIFTLVVADILSQVFWSRMV